jgi:Zn-dependent protease with chaperone function
MIPVSKTVLTGLRAHDFRHPLDLRATRSLQRLPGLDLAIRGLLGSVAEQFFQLENMSSSVLVGPQQLPQLHALMQEACHILDLEAPQLYVKQHPTPNAYTFAMRGKQPFVVVHTSLLDLLTPAEIQAVIGHELGHLKCDHSLYLTLANLITLAASFLPVGAALSQSLQAQLMEWVRCAEFSCDRAALLITQDAKVVASVLMKLAGGSPALAAQLNVDAFIEQARAYELISDTQLAEVVRQMRASEQTHPVPVIRAKEIDRWAGSQAYQEILTQAAGSQATVPQGGWRNW